MAEWNNTKFYKCRCQPDYNNNRRAIYLYKELKYGNPEKYILEQNYPNPFNQTTVINYQIPLSGRVILKVFDISGKEIAVLLDSYQSSGRL